MKSIAKPGAAIDWRNAFAELSFIPIVSDWLELLASRLAQPLMFMSSLYIIAETTIPGVAAWSVWLDLSARTSMSLAPEIILPGCFLQAQQAHRDDKDRKAKLLFTLFGLCIGLLAITLASFIWHFSGAITGVILFVRCGVGVAYTVVLKIDKEQGIAVTQPAPTAQAVPTPDELTILIANVVRMEISALRNEVRSDMQRLLTAQTQITPIAQGEQSEPTPLRIDTAQPMQRPRLAQYATHAVRTEQVEEDAEQIMVSSEQCDDEVSNEDEYADDEQPLTAQDTQPVETVQRDRDMRKVIFTFLDAQSNPLSITDNDVIAATKCSKSQARRYRGQYKTLRGDAQ